MTQMLRASFLALRPKQWSKNLLLFVGPFAAGATRDPNFKNLILGFMAFCIASSIGWLANDISDVEIDSKHPIKRTRPFASGRLSIKFGIFLGFSLAIPLIFLLASLPKEFNYLILAYVFNSFLYSKFLKKLPAIEMFSVAAGFVFRLLAGAVVNDLFISQWFLIVGGFGALFVVSCKRLAELKLQKTQEVRLVIKEYSPEFLTAIAHISVAVCITAYTFWAFSQVLNPFWFEISIIPFVMALFRYLWVSESDVAEVPENAIFSDKTLLILGALTLLILTLGIY